MLLPRETKGETKGEISGRLTMHIWCHRKSNTLCYYFILAAFIFSVFISIANFAKLKGSINIRVLQYVVQNPAAVGLFHVFHKVYS